MSDSVTTAYVQDYKNTVQMLSQQEGSRLRGAVTVGSYTGKAGKAIEQFGASNAQKRTSRFQSVSFADTPQDARWVYPTDYFWAEGIDNIDQLRAGIDLTSPLAKAGAMAMGRAIDDEILGSFFASAQTGENGTTSTAFDAGMVVGVNIGGTASGLNMKKLRDGQRLLLARNVPIQNKQVFAVITSREHDQLRNEIELIGSEYRASVQMDDNGLISKVSGVNLIVMEFTDTTTFANATAMIDGSSYNRIPMFTRDAMHLGMWEDLKADYGPRRDLVSTNQITLTETIGATRTDEDQIVEIKCNPAA